MTEKPYILITNDDGIDAIGIKTLFNALKDFAKISIVAPSRQRSGSGLGITVHDPLIVDHVPWENAAAWKVSGTPADCVRLALSVFLERKPDLIVSGVNPGANHGRILLYSGTVGGIIEGSLRGIPGVAFSCYDWTDPDLESAEKYILPIITNLLDHPLPKGCFLNVNFPPKKHPIRGVKMARQGLGYWIENIDEPLSKEGPHYFWPSERWHHHEEHEESDVTLLEKGFVTAVPIKITELTDHAVILERKESFESLFPESS
jgi:5'-nucleotidase